MTVHTCPGPRKPCTRLPGVCKIAVMAGGTSTWDTSIEKLSTPSARARVTASALAGAVVSKPTAKKTTSRPGLSCAMRTASSGAYTMRTSAPADFSRSRSVCEPGTRSMSPKDVKITPGVRAIACALSICSSGVTHTGQPGPCTSSSSAGSRRSMPCLTIECVCPPQTSISVHGRVVTRRTSATILAATRPSRYSSRYFMAPPRAPGARRAGRGPRGSGTSARLPRDRPC